MILIKIRTKFQKKSKTVPGIFFPWFIYFFSGYQISLPDGNTYFPRCQECWLQKAPTANPPSGNCPQKKGAASYEVTSESPRFIRGHIVSSKVTSLQGPGLCGSTKILHSSLIRRPLKEPFQSQSFSRDWPRTLVQLGENPPILWPILTSSLVSGIVAKSVLEEIFCTKFSGWEFVFTGPTPRCLIIWMTRLTSPYTCLIKESARGEGEFSTLLRTLVQIKFRHAMSTAWASVWKMLIT